MPGNQHDSASESSAPAARSISAPPRVWPGLVLVAVFWAIFAMVPQLDLEIFRKFFTTAGASLALGLLFSAWWLTNGRIPFRQRALAWLGVVIGGIVASLASDQSVVPFGIIFLGIPVAVSAWELWLLVARKRSAQALATGSVVAAAVGWSMFTVVRVDGIDGNNQAQVSWRWSLTAEQRYLEQLAKNAAAKADQPAGDDNLLVVQAGDWPEFRGPNRLGEQHGARIETDWKKSPPREAWRKLIGPAWSSVVVIGDRLFTQEQRGDDETTVCLDTATGREIWAHKDKVRYSDGQAGAGPRATPTFADGWLYTQGATGLLSCLDPKTGRLKWQRDIAKESGAALPMWGFSSSPLVVNNTVIAYAGGKGENGLLAYRADDGEPMWKVPTGQVSYSSPQLFTVGDDPQILLLSDAGLVSVDRAGKVLWQHEAAANGIWRVAQPRQLDDHSLLIGTGDLGLVRLDLSNDNQDWTAKPRFTTKSITPEFNDFVVHDGHIYGFDKAIFCCVDAETGKRKWKAGRYEHGQVLLLADQPLLVVVTEKTGEVVLVAANPEKHEELARLQALKGKTWNHPVVAYGRLFVRNDEEIVCYELASLDPDAAGAAK